MKSLLHRYENSGYVIRRKAQMLAFLCLTVLAVLPLAAVYSSLIGGMRANILIPLLLGMVPIAAAFVLLLKGQFTAAGHTVLFTSTVVIWTVLIFDSDSPVVVRLDTIAFVYGVMCMVPLLVVQQKLEVLTYCAINLVMFFVFSVGWLPEMGLSRSEFYDYVFDNLVTLLFISFAVYFSFDINQRALERAARDIAERKQAETRLTRLQHLLTGVIDSMPSAIIGLNVAGAITQWNREAEILTRISSVQALGRHFTNVIPELSYLSGKIENAIAKGIPIRDERISLTFHRNTRYYDITVYPLGVENIDGAVLRVDDISDRLQMEEMIIQSEKMMSLGGLAAGMAHEINNPLAGILQNAQVLKNRLMGNIEKNSAVAEQFGMSMDQLTSYCSERGIDEMLEAMEASGQRAAKIVGNMLSFSRKSNAQFSLQNIEALLDETCELASSDYDLGKNYDFRNIEIARHYQDDMPEVVCDENQIKQVLFNLITNAAQAMADENCNQTPRLTLRLSNDGDFVRIEIEDNGQGMDEEVRRRVFEPFFTTKEVGHGTGLGLSVSYFIVTENHGGTIAVSSTRGSGTRFTIRLHRWGPSLNPE